MYLKTVYSKYWHISKMMSCSLERSCFRVLVSEHDVAIPEIIPVNHRCMCQQHNESCCRVCESMLELSEHVLRNDRPSSP